MAKVLDRRETLYDEDLLAWAEQQGRFGEIARRAYGTAVERAAVETGLPRSTFPRELPYSAAEILGAAEQQPER